MADTKDKTKNEGPSTAPATPATQAKDDRKFVVVFSGITDKKGELRLKGETVTADELPDPGFQLSLGAIAEVAGSVEVEAPKPPEGNGQEK